MQNNSATGTARESMHIVVIYSLWRL